MADKYTDEAEALPVEKRDKAYWRGRILLHKAASEAAIDRESKEEPKRKKKPTLSEEMEADPVMRRILGLPELQARAVERK